MAGLTNTLRLQVADLDVELGALGFLLLVGVEDGSTDASLNHVS
jgi:hypothetical protein